MTLAFTNKTIEQAGPFLPATILFVVAVVQMIIFVVVLAPLLDSFKHRAIFDIDNLRAEIRRKEGDISEVIVETTVDQLVKVMIEEHEEIEKIKADNADIRVRKLSWSDLSVGRRALMIFLSIVAVGLVVYGVMMALGFVPPKPLPSDLDVTRPNGKFVAALRRGEVDEFLGFLGILMGVMLAFFVRGLFYRMISLSNESLKEFMREMKIK